MNVVLERSQLIELILPRATNLQTSVKFPDQPQLRDKRVTCIELFVSNDMQVSPLSNTAMIDMSTLVSSSATLTLYQEDPENETDTGQFTYYLPLQRLHYINNGTDLYSYNAVIFADLKLQWEKCIINFPKGIDTSGGALCIVLNAHYSSAKDNRYAKSGKIGGLGSDLKEWLNKLAEKVRQLEMRLQNKS